MSNDTCPSGPKDRHVREAARWLVRLQHPNLSPRVLLRWKRWQATAQNREAFDSLESIWRAIQPSDKGVNSTSAPRATSRPAHEIFGEETARISRGETVPATKLKSAGHHTQLAMLNLPGTEEPPGGGHERVRIIIEEAAYWYIRCTDDDQPMLPSDRREFLAWMRRSHENISALFKIAQLDGKLDRVKLVMHAIGMTGGNVIEFAAFGVPYLLHRELTELYDRRGEARPKKKNVTNSRWFKLIGVAASVCVGVGIAFLTVGIRHNQVVHTGLSEWQHMRLDDGTMLHVDAQTRLKVEFTPAERIVHVYEGSAVFEVAKDHKRPFIAQTALIDAIALGTRFGVSIESGVTTTVSKGIVKVVPRGQANGKSVTLKAGDELFIADNNLAQPSLTRVDAERKLEWAKGWFVFKGETIAQAAQEFNRRNSVQIKIEQAEIAARRIPGYARFRVDSPAEFASYVAHVNGLTLMEYQCGKVACIRLDEHRRP